MLKNLKYKLAFTLLEVMISILILTITVGSIYTISTQTKKIITKSEYSITAMYLSQEGLEFIRNIRDQRFSESLNRENGWDKFLKEDLGFGGVGSGGILIKKLNIKKNGEFEIKNSEKNFETQISSIDDICTDIGIYKNCIYEHVNIENLGNKKNNNFGKNFFRKIKIYKKPLETNLIKIESEILWEDHGKIENLILEERLGNIAIY